MFHVNIKTRITDTNVHINTLIVFKIRANLNSKNELRVLNTDVREKTVVK